MPSFRTFLYHFRITVVSPASKALSIDLFDSLFLGCHVAQVIKTILVASSEDHLQFVSYVEIPIETHNSCACQCRVQASDCNNLLQNYDPDSCQCLCRNVTTCVTPKHWDQTSCSCVCPIIFNCLDDEYFNYSTCS
jgi:hypothetical protein